MTGVLDKRISWHGGALLKVVLFLGGLFVVGAMLWIALLPGIVASTIHAKTGFIVKVERLSVNPLTADALISGLVVQNPEGWPDRDFVEVRQFQADVQLWPLLAGRFVANEVRADIAKVTLVKNQQGVLNSTAFANGFSSPRKSGGPAAGNSTSVRAGAPASPGGGKQGFLIRRLDLKFDQLVIADYSRQKPFVKTYDLQINSELTNVDSVAKLISPFTGAALTVAADIVRGVNPRDTDTLSDAVTTLQNAGKKAGESLKNLFRSLENKKP